MSASSGLSSALYVFSGPGPKDAIVRNVIEGLIEGKNTPSHVVDMDQDQDQEAAGIRLRERQTLSNAKCHSASSPFLLCSDDSPGGSLAASSLSTSVPGLYQLEEQGAAFKEVHDRLGALAIYGFHQPDWQFSSGPDARRCRCKRPTPVDCRRHSGVAHQDFPDLHVSDPERPACPTAAVTLRGHYTPVFLEIDHVGLPGFRRQIGAGNRLKKGLRSEITAAFSNALT